jgi:hypothetical protein
MISKQIAKTKIEGIATVSTILLPSNMAYGNPYETMIFDGYDNAWHDTRCATLDEALLAHIDAISMVIKKMGETNGL